MQRDTTAITAENKELKIRLQAMEQQAQLRDGNAYALACLFIGEIVKLFNFMCFETLIALKLN